MLVAELSCFSQSLINSKFVWDSWKFVCTPELVKINEFVTVCVLRVIGNMAKKLGRVAIGDLKGKEHSRNIRSIVCEG